MLWFTNKMKASPWMRRIVDLLPIFYAVLTRVMFFIHGFLSVLLLANCKETVSYWWLVIGILCLLVEMCYTLIVRKGHEYK